MHWLHQFISSVALVVHYGLNSSAQAKRIVLSEWAYLAVLLRVPPDNSPAWPRREWNRVQTWDIVRPSLRKKRKLMIWAPEYECGRFKFCRYAISSRDAKFRSARSETWTYTASKLLLVVYISCLYHRPDKYYECEENFISQDVWSWVKISKLAGKSRSLESSYPAISQRAQTDGKGW